MGDTRCLVSNIVSFSVFIICVFLLLRTKIRSPPVYSKKVSFVSFSASWFNLFGCLTSFLLNMMCPYPAASFPKKINIFSIHKNTEIILDVSFHIFALVMEGWAWLSSSLPTCVLEVWGSNQLPCK